MFKNELYPHIFSTDSANRSKIINSYFRSRHFSVLLYYVIMFIRVTLINIKVVSNRPKDCFDLPIWLGHRQFQLLLNYRLSLPGAWFVNSAYQFRKLTSIEIFLLQINQTWAGLCLRTNMHVMLGSGHDQNGTTQPNLVAAICTCLAVTTINSLLLCSFIMT